MNILYIHQYFMPTDGVRSYEFIKKLCADGNKVTVITAFNVEFEMDNLTVISTNTKYSNHMSKMQRILSFIGYMIKSTVWGLRKKNIDVLYASSTPITVGIPAIIISKLKKCIMIFEVRDVWPDIPVEMGFIKSKPIIWLLKKFEKKIYKCANHIVPLSKGMYENILNKGVNPNKLTIIENISNKYLYSSFETILQNREKEPFTVIHPGTMGIVNGLDFILDTAKIIEDKSIKFLLIGDGNRKEALKKRIEEENITNVQLQDSVSKAEVASLTEKAHIGFMCVDTKYNILKDNSANKFFDFLAAGLPVVINYEGWQKEVIENAGCGFSVLTPEEMAKKIMEIKNSSIMQMEMAKNAYHISAGYSTDEAYRKLKNVLNNL